MDDVLFFRVSLKDVRLNGLKSLNVITYRPFKTLNDLKWQLLTFGTYKRWLLIKNGRDRVVLCTAHTNNRAFIFPFMGKKSVYIGKCTTPEVYRGNGYYPLLLRYIIEKHKNKKIKFIYITVNTTNKASIQGIRKAGFSLFGMGYRDLFKRYKIRILLSDT